MVKFNVNFPARIVVAGLAVLPFLPFVHILRLMAGQASLVDFHISRSYPVTGLTIGSPMFP